MSEEQPYVCDDCRAENPGKNWNSPCIHTPHGRLGWFVWQAGPIGWLKGPIPQWTFWEWRFCYPKSFRWLVIGRLAVRISL